MGMFRAKTRKPPPVKRIALALAVLALIGLRLCLPILIRDYANRRLARSPDYRGRIERVGISLWRGAYRFEGVKLEKLDGPPVAFFSCERLSVSLEWRALLRGAVVAKVHLRRPVVNFVAGPSEAKSQTGLEQSWARTLEDLMPITVDRLVVEGGEAHYRDLDSKPPVDLMLSEIKVVARNLSTVKRDGKALPAEVEATAACFGSGTLIFRLAFDPLKKDPTFELKQTLEGVQLAKLNDFFEAYAKFRLKGGEFGLYTEIAARDGRFLGYSKPFFKDVVVETSERKGMRKVWAGIAAAAARLLTNQKEEQVATKIPLEGTFAKTDVGVWTAVRGLLMNAFVQALAPTLEDTVRLSDVPPAKE